MTAYLGASGHQVDHLLHFTPAFAASRSWLPRQLPLAILAAAAEAAVVGWLSWLHTDEWDMPSARPGLLVALRRAAAKRAIRAGGVVTRDGSCLGLVAGSGARVTLSWSEAAGGVTVCGTAETDVLGTSFQLVHAAVRRRKPVFAVDLTGDEALLARGWPRCAPRPARPCWSSADRRGPRRPAVCASLLRAVPARRSRAAGGAAGRHDQLGRPGGQYRRSCVAYLEDVFELIDAAPGDPRVPVLDEVIHLLNPTAMRARMEHVPAAYPRRGVLAERTRVSMSVLARRPGHHRRAHPAAARPAHVSGLAGGYGRPPRAAAGIDVRRVVAERGVVLFRLGGSPDPAVPGMLTRLICQDLLTVGAALRGLGVDGDGIGVAGRLRLDAARRRHRDDHPRPGGRRPVLATATAGPAAAELAELANVVVAHRMGAGHRPARAGRCIRLARRRVPARGQRPRARSPAGVFRPGPGPLMTPPRAGRLHLGWQYATPLPDPGPPPLPPDPPDPERLDPAWVAAQRREECLISRPLRAACAWPRAAAAAVFGAAAAGWLPGPAAALGVAGCGLAAAASGYGWWRGERALQSRVSAERSRIGLLRAAQRRELSAGQAGHVRRVQAWQPPRPRTMGRSGGTGSACRTASVASTSPAARCRAGRPCSPRPPGTGWPPEARSPCST